MGVMDHSQIPITVSDTVYQRRLAAVTYARGSVRLEGFVLSPEVEVIHQQYVCGQITAEERLQAVLKRHQKKSGEGNHEAIK